MPSEFQTTSAQNYIIYSVSGLWKQNFMNQEVKEEDLFKSLDFAVDWFKNNLNSEHQTEKDLLIAFGLDIKAFAEKNAQKFNRPNNMSLMLVNKTKSFNHIVSEIMKMKALAKD